MNIFKSYSSLLDIVEGTFLLNPITGGNNCNPGRSERDQVEPLSVRLTLKLQS